MLKDVHTAEAASTSRKERFAEGFHDARLLLGRPCSSPYAGAADLGTSAANPTCLHVLFAPLHHGIFSLWNETLVVGVGFLGSRLVAFLQEKPVQ